MESSVPNILPPRFESLVMPSKLYAFIVKFLLYLYLVWEENENKQKETGFGPFLKSLLRNVETKPQSHLYQGRMSGRTLFLIAFMVWLAKSYQSCPMA